MTKKLLSILVCVTLLFSALPVFAEDTLSLELSVASGSVFYTLPDTIEADGVNFDKVVYVVDDYNTITTEDGVLNLEDLDLPYGKHKVVAVALSENASYTKEVTFTYKQTYYKVNMSNNFDQYYQDDNDKLAGSPLKEIYHSGTIVNRLAMTDNDYITGNGVYFAIEEHQIGKGAITAKHVVKSVPGKNAANDSTDKAILYQYGATPLTMSSNPHMNFSAIGVGDTGVTSKIDETKGVLNVEFDLKMNSEYDYIQLLAIQTICGDFKVTTQNKDGKNKNYWLKPNKQPSAVALSTDWVHIQNTLDFDNNRIIFKVDNNVIGDVSPIPAKLKNSDGSTYQGNNGYRFGVYDAGWRYKTSYEGSDLPGYTVDNVKVTQTINYKGIDSCTFNDGNSNSASTDDVKLGSQIVLSVPDGLDSALVDTTNVTLKTLSGTKVDLTSVSYDETLKTLTVTPLGNMPDAEKLVLSLSGDMKYADGTLLSKDHCVYFSTETTSIKTEADFKVGTSSLIVPQQLKPSQTVTAKLTPKNMIGVPVTFHYIMTFVDDNKVCAMDLETVSNLAGYDPLNPPTEDDKVTLSFTLPSSFSPDGDKEVYVMICDEEFIPVTNFIKIG